MAVDQDTAAERAYLDALASKLKLDPALVAEIHRTAGEHAPQQSTVAGDTYQPTGNL
jgi:uncharacterized membrane protein YebE (DUF533 family)